MKFSIEAKDLVRAIAPINKALGGKRAIPITQNYRIEASEEKNHIKFQATTMDKAATVIISANVICSGSAIVDGRLFFKIIKKMSDCLLWIEVKEFETCISIKSDDTEVKINLDCCADLFPLISSYIPHEDEITINSKHFMYMINKTIFACSTEQNRPVFTGIYWRIRQNGHIVAATDGKRISEITYNCDTEVRNNISLIIPTDFVNLLEAVLKETETCTLKMYSTKYATHVQCDNYTLMFNQIEGDYPEYEKVFGNDLSKHSRVTVRKDELLTASDLVSILGCYNKICLHIVKDRVSVSAVSREIGDAKKTIKCNSEIDDFKIGFDQKFLKEMLTAMEVVNVTLNIDIESGLRAPIVFSGDNRHTFQSRYLLMPLRLTSGEI